MNENDDVMGFNDEPPATPDFEPENIPDSAYVPGEASQQPNIQAESEIENNSDEYAGYEGWEAEDSEGSQNESNNLTANSSSQNTAQNSKDNANSDGTSSESNYNSDYTDNDESQAKKLLDTEPSEKVDITQRNKNKGMFLKRQKILLVLSGIFVLFILFFTFIFPEITAKKNKDKAKELDKNGKQYIPSALSNEIVEQQKVSNNQTDFSGGNSAMVQEEELSSKYPALVEETPVQQKNIAPVAVPDSGNNSPSVPITNRNEQQKQPQRLALEKTTSPTEAEAQKSGTRFPTTKPQGYNTGYNSGYSGTNTQASSSYMPQNLSANLDKFLAQQSGGNLTSSYVQQNNQSAKQEFLNKNGIGGNYQWNAEFSLWKGTIISVVLDTGINTDLPGQVMGHVTKNVFSSQDGRYLLIPQGSRLFGEYSSDISYGQNRIQVVWNTLIRPDGLEINLGSMNGIDAYGASGYKGWKTDHPFEYVKAFGLIAAYSILDTKAMNLIDAQNNAYAQNALSDVYSETKKLNNKIVDRALDIQPTIRIPSGTEVNLITNVTIDLPPLERYEVDEKYVRY